MKPGAVQSNTPGNFYGTTCLILLVLLGALTTAEKPDRPPAVAELNADDGMSSLRLEQSNSASFSVSTGAAGGHGGGGGSAGGFGEGGSGGDSGAGSGLNERLPLKEEADASSAGSTAARTFNHHGAQVETGSFENASPAGRRCVQYPGFPPQQIEDPQSPPCVSGWSGDNGGATAKGVYSDTINIGFPGGFTSAAPLVPLLENFFNSRFEFYGRRIKILSCPAKSDVNATTDTFVNDAISVSNCGDHPVFASLSNALKPNNNAYFDKLAELGVVSVKAHVQETDAGKLIKPSYQYSYVPDLETVENNVAEFVCKQLNGYRPEYAGSEVQERADVLGTKRIFAFVSDAGTSLKWLDAALEPNSGCLSDKQPSPIPRYEAPGPDNSLNEDKGAILRQHASGLADFRLKGVTTIVCLCAPQAQFVNSEPAFWALMAARQQGYEPEWILTSFGGGSKAGVVSPYYGDRATPEGNSVMNISFRDGIVPTDELPATWAARESNPGFVWGKPTDSGKDVTAHAHNDNLYKDLLILASGIQMAGPNLTADTFASGLQNASARWPNPQTSYKAASVGFSDNNYMNDDAALMWWNPQKPSDIDPATLGSYCYAEDGKRWAAGRWPVRQNERNRIVLFDPQSPGC